MALLVTDPDLETRLIEARREANAHDEVWEGLYVTAPLPNDDHQDIQGGFLAMLKEALGWDSPAKIRPGVNVSDRDEDWQFNYRGPDVVVYLPGNPAKNFGTHWQGGPDFLVEIISPYDRSRDKLSFYGKVGVREALFIDRDPWGLELYVAGENLNPMQLAAKTQVNGPSLASGVLPLVFRLVPGEARPKIEVMLTSAFLANRTCWII
jgi:Uma2 family endonuclease